MLKWKSMWIPSEGRSTVLKYKQTQSPLQLRSLGKLVLSRVGGYHEGVHKKDYSHWQGIKTVVNNDKERPQFHEREIWFASLGSNIGFEQDGRGEHYLRPVIVIRKFNNDVCLVVPLTKNQKQGIHYYAFSYKEDLTSTAILSQVRLIDSKRLDYKSGYAPKEDFIRLKQKLKQLLA